MPFDTALECPITAQPIEVDLRDPALRDDPQSLYRRWRTHGGIRRDTLGIWLLLGHAHARTVLQDARLSRDPRGWRGYAQLRPFIADSTLERSVERWMLFNDPPAHTRLRRAVGAAFTPAAVRRLRDAVRRTAQRLVDALPANGSFDLLRDFAQPFPVRVIGDLLGLPPDDFAQTKAWSDSLALVVEPASARELRSASDRAAAQMLEYLSVHVAQRRLRPGDDLLGDIVREQDDALSTDELLANLMLLFVAGHETTTNLIGNGMLTLLRHPGELARLRSDPALIGTAVEEMLRYDGPANMVARIARAPYRIGDHLIGAGDLLYCMVGAANRDPSVFAEPDRFDIGRRPNPHLAFGGGVHYCVGAPLARLEAEVAFECLLARFPTLALAPEPVHWRPMINLRGLTELRLVGRA